MQWDQVCTYTFIHVYRQPWDSDKGVAVHIHVLQGPITSNFKAIHYKAIPGVELLYCILDDMLGGGPHVDYAPPSCQLCGEIIFPIECVLIKNWPIRRPHMAFRQEVWEIWFITTSCLYSSLSLLITNESLNNCWSHQSSAAECRTDTDGELQPWRAQRKRVLVWCSHLKNSKFSSRFKCS